MAVTHADLLEQEKLAYNNWPSETYIPWFPPCQPCGHCPSCGRGGLPLRWPYWQYVGVTNMTHPIVPFYSNN